LFKKNADNQIRSLINSEKNKVSMEQDRMLSLPDEVVLEKIHVFRDQNVMLDKDLAELYGVTTGNLNKAVLRNNARFPDNA
jgi:hypothetical protein